ncbi:MAG: helix-hairpin-helix domain-containing protein [Agathobacter sp.]|nr:helix-hairpin-helix domain-containing protein [Agathobacter sp.]
MKNFINLLKSVLLCTLIVVCICGCNKGTAQYIHSEEKGTSEWTEVETEEGSTEHTQQVEETEKTMLYVYVCGAVKSPGVYMLSTGSRICDLFEAANGLKKDASTDYWNQARLLTDGEMIYVPTIEEVEERQWSGLDSSLNPLESASANDTSGKIDLNTASLEQLMGIPGIGEAKAKAIISYRENNGGFSSIEDVMNIEGIKEGVFSKMKEYIVVN